MRTRPLVLLVAALTAAAPAWGEKHVQSTLDSRLVLAFKANPAEVQRWLPALHGLDHPGRRKPALYFSGVRLEREHEAAVQRGLNVLLAPCRGGRRERSDQQQERFGHRLSFKVLISSWIEAFPGNARPACRYQ